MMHKVDKVVEQGTENSTY